MTVAELERELGEHGLEAERIEEGA